MNMHLATAILLLFSAPLQAEEIESPHVSVYGTATTMIVPDEMTWRLGVKNTGSELEDVADQHLEIVQRTLRVLKKEDIAEKEIQTTKMEFGENRVPGSGFVETEGYFASTEISFKIDDFEDYRSLWRELSKIENVSINRVSYGSSKRIEYQRETMKKALLAAEDKARMLAQTIGSGIGKALMIEEMESYGSATRLNNVTINQNSDIYSGEEFMPGKISVRTRIKAVFELIEDSQ
jgi:uncharacterized protein YggE